MVCVPRRCNYVLLPVILFYFNNVANGSDNVMTWVQPNNSLEIIISVDESFEMMDSDKDIGRF